MDKNLYRQLDAMNRDTSRRDVKQNYAFHKDIRHNTERCVTIKDEIKRLIGASHSKEFLDEPQAATKDEWPHQRSKKTLPKYMC